MFPPLNLFGDTLGGLGLASSGSDCPATNWVKGASGCLQLFFWDMPIAKVPECYEFAGIMRGLSG